MNRPITQSLAAGLPKASARLGRFVLLQEIGAGAMGRIYAAYDEALDRRVAIELLREDGPGDEDRTRIHREAQAIARRSHPNVAQIRDVGEIDARLYLAIAQSALNRGVAAFFLCAIGVVLALRGTIWAIGADPRPTCVYELCALAALSLLSAATAAPWFGRLVVVLVAARGRLSGLDHPDLCRDDRARRHPRGVLHPRRRRPPSGLTA